MKSSRAPLLLVLAIAGLFLLYTYGVKPFERLALEGYYQIIIKNRVAHKNVLTQQEVFQLGIYRPELPYQFSQLYAMQESLGVRFSIVSYYQAWGDEPDNMFKTRVNRNLTRGGFVPLITWEPWIAGFKGYKGQNPEASLHLLASGAFDGYIRSWAREAVRFGKPFFLRPGHEMSNPWYSWSQQYGNTPGAFKAFWQRVYRLFQEEGARNAAFVWNPYTPADTAFYPGDDFVDWIGLDIFNFGSLSQEGIWMDFYITTKLLYDAVKFANKPILVAETGCAAAGGNKNNWYRDMFHSLAAGNFPLIKALVLFDTPLAITPTGISVDLGFSGDSAVYGAVNRSEFTEKLHIQSLQKGTE
ncbi:MAG: glycosyl hydrolase [Fibrobacterota bacterium]